jgi:hypothetical protein
MNHLGNEGKSIFELYSQNSVSYFDKDTVEFFVEPKHVENFKKILDLPSISRFSIFEK